MPLCPTCGCLIDEGIDCQAAEYCAAEPDDVLFAPYQPRHRPPYQLSDCYDRTALAIAIQAAIARREDYLGVIKDLLRARSLSVRDYHQRRDEALTQRQRHRRALLRLADHGSY